MWHLHRRVLSVCLILLFLGAWSCGGGSSVSQAQSAAVPGPQGSGTTAGSSSSSANNAFADQMPDDTSATLDYFEGFATGQQQFTTYCARGLKDLFSVAYCANATPPSITSMDDLLTLLGMKTGAALSQGTNFAFNSQNASLVSRDTSLLNPRAIVYRAGTPFIALGFTRGSDLVEIAGFDQNSNDINFALLHYSHACDATHTCTNADRFLPSNESGWLNVSVYSGHEDLNNTPRQCDTCHRPDGYNFTTNTGATSILRMQQLVNPWMTWFRSNRGGAPLLATFCAAHANEEYAGVPFANVCPAPEKNGGDPATMQTTLIQPHNFQKDAHVIIFQGNQINGDKIANVGPPNSTWLAFFQQVLNGALIHIPYFAIDAFDAAKVSTAQAGYAAVQTGKAAPASMPDLTADALMVDSARPLLGHEGIATNPVTGNPATANEVVNQMCATCHAGIFPGSGNREKFVVTDFPSKLSADEKATVANRICRPDTSRYAMPPVMFATMTAANRALILTALGYDPTCPTEP